MQVLQTPLTWIIAAGVLLVVAVALLALGHHRRVRADREATDEAAVTGPVAVPAAAAPRPEGPRTGGFAAPGTGGQPVVGPATGSQPVVRVGADRGDGGAPVRPRYVAAPRTVSHPAPAPADPRPGPSPMTGPRPAPAPTTVGLGAGPDGADATHRPALHDGTPHAAEPEPVRDARPEQDPDAPAPPAASTPVPDAGRRRVEDRLLAAVLRDPDEAVRALAGLEDGEPLGRAAGRLLRAGLTPAQVAELCDVAPADLASVVAADLGLLPATTPVDRCGRVGAHGRREPDAQHDQDDGDQDGTSCTVDPGRAWANVGSATASTTPTTG